MRALSLWQPWASLTCITNPATGDPYKWIETRSWSTSYRGPLAIHAAKSTKGITKLPGDCEGKTEAGWCYGFIGDWQAGYCFQTSDEGRRGDTFMVRLNGDSCELRPPLGAVVATCTLVDVVPIVAVDAKQIPRTRFDHDVLAITPSEQLVLAGDVASWHWRKVTAQLPYGDFRPGRYAWLLDDITELVEPIPTRGYQSLWDWRAA